MAYRLGREKESQTGQVFNLLQLCQQSRHIATTCLVTKKALKKKVIVFKVFFFLEKFGFTIRPQTAIAPEESWSTSGRRRLRSIWIGWLSGSAGGRSPRTAASAWRPQSRKTGLRFCHSRFCKIKEIK
jgi:hypothetical protein